MKNLLINKKHNFQIKHIYYIGMFLFIGISIFNCIYTKGEALYDMLVPNYTNHYWDLFTSIYHNFLGTPYEEGVVYPPGANLICLIMSKFFSDEMYIAGTNAMRDSHIGMFLNIWFLTITTVILIKIMFSDLKTSKLEKILFVMTILVSAPYIRELTKMNVIMVSIICVYLFLILKDSSKWMIRLLAMFFLAIAVSIKIYPVFFGLFFIKDKRWKEVFSCVFIGLIVFFIPFFGFGGIHNVLLMFENIFDTTTILNQSGLGFKIDITNTINILGLVLGYEGNIRFIGTIINYCMLFLGALSFFFLKSTWKSIAIVSLMTLSYPTFSNSYAVLIMIPALICFLNTEKKTTIWNSIYIILFVLLFAPMCFGGQDILPVLPGVTRVNLFTFIESISIAVMQLLLIVEGIFGLKTTLTEIRRNARR